MATRNVFCVALLAAVLLAGAAAASPSAGHASRTSYAATFLSAFRTWSTPTEAPRSDEEGFYALAKWLVPPKHKLEFASVFMDAKEKVLGINDGITRVDLLQPAMDLANFIYIEYIEFQNEKAYKEHFEYDAVKELLAWVSEHNVVLFQTPINPVSGGEWTEDRGEALSPVVIDELEALMDGELGMAGLAGAAHSHEELALQLDAHAASRNGGETDKVVLLTKYFVPPSVAADFSSKWVELKDKSLETEEGTEQYGIFSPCATNAVYFSNEVYANWDAAKTHLSEDFVNDWWEYTRSANIPVKALPLVFVSK